MNKYIAFFCFLSVLLSCKKDDDAQIMVLTGDWGIVREEIHYTVFNKIVIDSLSINNNLAYTLSFFSDTMLLKNQSDTIKFGKYETKNDTIYCQHYSVVLKSHFYFKSDTLVMNEKTGKMMVSCSVSVPSCSNGTSVTTCSDPVLVEESTVNSFYIRK